MTKDFPKSRITIVNVYPLFEKGLKSALAYCKTNNFSVNTNEGKQLLLYFCTQTIQETYTKIKTPFPKVLYLANEQINPNFNSFVQNHFQNLMEYIPYPYCGIYNSNSPDLEFASLAALKRVKPKRRFINFLNKLNVKNPQTLINEPSFSV